MIAILGFLARLSIIFGFGALIFTTLSDLIIKTTYLETLDNLIYLSDPKVMIIISLISVVYMLIFILSYINKFTKYSQKRKLKSKNGELEVTIKTINEISKEFLSSQPLVKNVKVKSYPAGKNVVIEGNLDTYTTENLGEKLLKLQDELAEYVLKFTGIKVKKVKLKLKKVLNETLIENKIEDTEQKNETIEENREEQ